MKVESKTINRKQLLGLSSAAISAVLLVGCDFLNKSDQLNGRSVIDCALKPGEGMTVRLNSGQNNLIAGRVLINASEGVYTASQGGESVRFSEGNPFKYSQGSENYFVEASSGNLVLTVFC